MSRTKVIVYFGQSKQIYISVSAPKYFQNQILINVSTLKPLWIVLRSGKTRVKFCNRRAFRIALWFTVCHLTMYNQLYILAFQHQPPSCQQWWIFEWKAQYKGCVIDTCSYINLSGLPSPLWCVHVCPVPLRQSQTRATQFVIRAVCLWHPSLCQSSDFLLQCNHLLGDRSISNVWHLSWGGLSEASEISNQAPIPSQINI